MKYRGLLIATLVLLGVGLLAGLFLATFQRRDVVETIPPSGAARYDPFLALELSLQRLGQPVTVLATLDARRAPLAPGDTLLLGADAARVDVDTARRLVAWVRGGGHLLLAPDNSLRLPLFEALGLPGKSADELSCHRLSAELQATYLCGHRFRLPADAKPTAAIGDAAQGYLFARLPLGKGQLSLLADFGPLQHQQLKQADAQAFAWQLLAPGRGHGRLYVVYALDGPPFLQWLALRGWPALLALAVLLAAWMRRRSARLGPLLPAPALPRRALLEHVQAAGEFLYRRDGGHSLHHLACQAVLARLRRRDPGSARLGEAALHERLAERSGLDRLLVAKAFQPPANAQAFRASLITLARLGSHA